MSDDCKLFPADLIFRVDFFIYYPFVFMLLLYMADNPLMLLTVKKGVPFRRGEIFRLDNNELIIGREADPALHNLIGFSCDFISRKHLKLLKKNGSVYAVDMNSKNGTQINGSGIDAKKEYRLTDGDIISLANDDVVLEFHVLQQDAAETPSAPGITEKPSDITIRINEYKKEISINDCKIDVSGKLFTLLLLFCSSIGKVLEHDEIKKALWPERKNLEENGTPVAYDYELPRMVERLRGKLGKYRSLILTKRTFGYMLDESCIIEY